MDRSFPLEKYRLTDPRSQHADIPTALAHLADLLAEQTERLRHQPYNPTHWLARAETLQYLRYPELAVGDAWKAGELCRGILEKRNRRRWGLGAGWGFWMLQPNSGPDSSSCSSSSSSAEDEDEEEDLRWSLGLAAQREDEDDLEERVINLQAEAHRLINANLALSPNYEEGKMLSRKYPWMEERHEMRDDALLEEINQEFEETGCRVQRHAFGLSPQDGGKTSYDILGVFATEDIASGSTILVDSTTDFYGLLETIMHSEAQHQHPLDQPLPARLTPSPETQKVHLFSLNQDIAAPLLRLQETYGIDIFASQEWETWVLFTLHARLRNNVWGGGNGNGDENGQGEGWLSSRFSLFNHSCEPNCSWGAVLDQNEQDEDRWDKQEKDGANEKEGKNEVSKRDTRVKVKVEASKDIKRGEQLCVMYDGFLRDAPLGERQRRLGRWMADGCRCVRCVREGEEQEDERKRKKGGNTKQKEGSKGRKVRKPVVAAAWDDREVVPVFPEDNLLVRA